MHRPEGEKRGFKVAAKTQASSAKRSSNSTRSKSTSRKSSGARKSPSAKATTRQTNSRAGTSSRARSNGNQSTRSRASRNDKGGVVDTAKSVAGKAAAPAAAVGAAAVGIASGIALRARMRRKTVLGVPLPRSFGKGKGLPDIDGKSIAKSVGQASKRFAKTTKNVSKDLERAGDQAERIGKILD